MNSLIKWLIGFTKLGELEYFPGWNAWRFFPVYLLNHGSHVLTGGAVVTWSRWLYEHRNTSRIAKFLTRLLNFFDAYHGRDSGGTLWETKDLPAWIRLVIVAVWVALGYFL
jgi:hypothetical protein